MRFGSGFRAIVACFLSSSLASAATFTADSFGSDVNQFEITFVTISGNTNPTSGYGIVDYDYRMGVFEITNDQWNKFKASIGGTVTGDPLNAYDDDPHYASADQPTNNVSWYEAAQFANWLNTSTGHQVAYKFTGTQGQSDYTFTTWDTSEAWGGTNLYRHKDALYFLPDEDEWVKAAYWNGTSLQLYATRADESLTQGDGISGIGWNYSVLNGTNPSGPWDVGSGSEELNGTHDMMGNVFEWMESPYDTAYNPSSSRGMRGGCFFWYSGSVVSSHRTHYDPTGESRNFGFRVASSAAVPEPGSLIIWACGGLGALVLRRRRKV